MANLKPFLDDIGVALEKQAAQQFGAAVEDFTRTMVGGTPGATRTPTTPSNRNDGSFYASSYAHALAGGTPYRPKLKFLFKVEFVFTREAEQEFPTIFGGAARNDFTFMVRSVDRPKIDFEYEDDINMYNFRTKVLKRIRHRELTVTFMDDSGNKVINFFRALMMMHSPITRRQLRREGSTAKPDPSSLVSGNGMVFSTDANNPYIGDNAHRGVTNNSVGNVIETIRVKQIYVDPGEALGSAVKEVIYDFINARIVSFDLDELTHDTSDVSLMTMQFDYDWMEIVETGSLQSMDGPAYKVAVAGVNGAPVDATVYAGGLTSPQSSPFSGVLAGGVGRAVGTVTTGAISRAVQTVAGKGQFGKAISSGVSSIVGAAARDMAASVTQSISQATARAISRNILDSAVGPTKASGVVKSIRGLFD